MISRANSDDGEKIDRLEIVDGIKRGIADVEAGRVVPHDEAMAEIYAVITTAIGSKR